MAPQIGNADQLEHAEIQASGALLWRQSPEGNQVAVIFRNRYQDWTLPKGKLQEGENWEQAALREVVEETGYKGQITGFAGAISYLVNGKTKIVVYWHMSAIEPPIANLDIEVNHMEWLTVEEALHRLQYPLERSLLEIWKDGAETNR